MKQTLDELRLKLKGIKKSKFNRLVMLIEFCLYKKDGSPTAFAKKFNIDSPEDLYDFFKQTKKLLKKDREDEAFLRLTELSKSAYGRTLWWVKDAFKDQLKDQSPDAPGFIAHVFIFRTLGFALDNLKELKVVFKEFSETEIDTKQITAKEAGMTLK